ncbi:hypothetical protein OG474_34930 [Kribbella sp. NBC_01505]|uniref:hypothetical protein n=1 Tax=Kribbella sp. NBC_01505 TaxID=2903580 RepID=UPI00386BA4D9
MQIVPIAHTSTQVQFTSDAGSAIARWMGAGPPELGVPVDVELDLASPYRWDEVEVLAEATPGLSIGPDGTVLCAQLVQVEGDGVVTLGLPRVEFPAESVGEAPPPGVFVRFAVELALWPTGL